MNFGHYVVLSWPILFVLLSTLVAKDLQILVLAPSVSAYIFASRSVLPASRACPAVLHSCAWCMSQMWLWLKLCWLSPVLVERLIEVI